MLKCCTWIFSSGLILLMCRASLFSSVKAEGAKSMILKQALLCVVDFTYSVYKGCVLVRSCKIAG